VVNEFTDSKSPLKFFEAGVLGVPTVASATETFRDAINDGCDGFLATSVEQWSEKIALALDGRRSRILGARARATTFARFSFAAHRGRLRDALLPLAGNSSGPAPGLLPSDVGRQLARESPRRRLSSRPVLLRRQVQLLLDRAPGEDPSSATWGAPLDVAFVPGPSVGVPDLTAWSPAGDLRRAADDGWAAIGFDPMLLSPDLRIETADARYLVVRMRATSDVTPAMAQLFWRHDGARGFDEANSLRWPIRSDGELRTYVLDLAATRWRAADRVRALRFDPLAAPGRVTVESVDLAAGPLPTTRGA
jgi:hypothetical protein